MRAALSFGLCMVLLSGCARAYRAESAYVLPRNGGALVTGGQSWLTTARRNEQDTRMVAFRSRDREAEAWFEVTALPQAAGPVSADVAARQFGRALQDVRTGNNAALRKFGMDVQFVERSFTAIGFGEIPGAIVRLDLVNRYSGNVVANIALCVTTAVGTIRESRASRDARFLFIGALAASPSSFERHFPAWANALETIHHGFIAPAESAGEGASDESAAGETGRPEVDTDADATRRADAADTAAADDDEDDEDAADAADASPDGSAPDERVAPAEATPTDSTETSP